MARGRAALYRAVLEPAQPERHATLARARQEVEEAVAGLRRAATIPELPRSLMTRAWLRVLAGDCRGARVDLDEAWQLAERGSMRLHMADIHLHRVRLFFREEVYPWGKEATSVPHGPQADLVAARQIIEVFGYGRRRKELADLEAAIGMGSGA